MRPPHPFSIRSFCFMAALFLAALGSNSPAETPIPDAPPDTTTPANLAQDYISKGTKHMADGDADLAANAATSAIQIDPKNAGAYELRASAYMKRKIWDRAERDYAKADQLSPDSAYKFQLAKIKYLQRSYGDARSRFALLQKDPRLGDLATYNVFLCDLLGSHESIAKQDLDAMDQAGESPARYYAHGAWCLFHRQREEMVEYFGAARKIYDQSTCERYLMSIVEAQRFHLSTATFTAKDGVHYDKSSIFLEPDGLRILTEKGWITLQIDQLPDDLSPFPEDMQDQITKRRAVVPYKEAPVSLVSLTTKTGKTYDRVRWSLNDTGLGVLSSEGWITIPFEQLPADESSFPPDLKQSLVRNERLKAAAEPVVSFTTRQGQRFDQVRAMLSETSVRVVGPTGWTAVPFDQLPADLSAFPADWQTKIRAGLKTAPSAATGPQLVTFTTKTGTHFDQVRADLGSRGLRLLTDQGLKSVPYDQLPDDLSAFPEGWRQQIITKRKVVQKPAASSAH